MTCVERKLTNHVKVSPHRQPPHKHHKESKPSGLVKNWESKGTGIARGSRNGQASTPQDGPVPSGGFLGGLADEDVVSERPPSKTPRSRDMTQRNEASP
jgi:hypothetical protein